MRAMSMTASRKRNQSSLNRGRCHTCRGQAFLAFRGNTLPKCLIQTRVLRASKLMIMLWVAFFCAQAQALPIQPNIKLLLDQIKQPSHAYVPARAGWNGPEEKSATASRNAAYDKLMEQPTPAQIRQQMLSTAKPDWRVLVMIAAVVLILRSRKGRQRVSRHYGTVQPIRILPAAQPEISRAA